MRTTRSAYRSNSLAVAGPVRLDSAVGTRSTKSLAQSQTFQFSTSKLSTDQWSVRRTGLVQAHGTERLYLAS